MKHAYSQSERQAFLDEGRSIIVGFRSSASLVWSHGTKSIILQPHARKVSGMPFMKRGRTQAVTPEHFDKLLHF